MHEFCEQLELLRIFKDFELALSDIKFGHNSDAAISFKTHEIAKKAHREQWGRVSGKIRIKLTV